MSSINGFRVIFSLTCEKCDLRDLLRIKESKITKLKQVNDDLDDLCYHEPARHQEVEAKMSIVNKRNQDTLAEARQLILRIAHGWEVCHPDE